MTLAYRLPPGQRHGDELQCLCPNPACPNPKKFSFNLKKGMGQCFRCGYVIHNEKEAIDAFGAADNLRPPGSWVKAETQRPQLQEAGLNTHAFHYLLARGVDFADLDNTLCDPQTKMVYFRCADVEDPNAVWYHRRVIGKDSNAWRMEEDAPKSRLIFANWPVTAPPQPFPGLLLVEGIFDVLSPSRLLGTWNAVSLLGTRLYRPVLCWLVRSGLKHAGLWFDPDDAGRKATKQIKYELESYGVRVTEFDYPREPGDCTQKDLPWLQHVAGVMRA